MAGAALAVIGERAADAREGAPIVGTLEPESLRDARGDLHGPPRCHRSSSPGGVVPADDTEIAAYLVEPGRSGYLLADLAAEYGIEAPPDPPAEHETEALVRARRRRSRWPPFWSAFETFELTRCTGRSSFRWPVVLRRWRTPG